MRAAGAALLAAALALPGCAATQAQQDGSMAAAANDLRVRVHRDLAYGPHPRQRLDVYLPGAARGPLLLVVHGGAWVTGDKRSPSMIVPKVRYWTARGFVVVAVNHRFAPDTRPLEQARDVARALALVQRLAGGWGADPQRAVLMGHSSGAHLVTLLNAAPSIAYAQGAGPWRGAVSLDNPVMDVPATMRAPHAPLFDRAFGADPAGWQSASPLQVLSPEAPPLLAICSRLRGPACAQAQRLREAAAKLGREVRVEGVDRNHARISSDLGLPGPYSDAVERWISSIL